MEINLPQFSIQMMLQLQEATRDDSFLLPLGIFWAEPFIAESKRNNSVPSLLEMLSSLRMTGALPLCWLPNNSSSSLLPPAPLHCVRFFGLYSSSSPSALIFPLTSALILHFAAKPHESWGSLRQRCNCSLAIKELLMPCSKSYGNAANASSNASEKQDPLSSLTFEEILCRGLLVNTGLRRCILTHLSCFSFLFSIYSRNEKLRFIEKKKLYSAEGASQEFLPQIGCRNVISSGFVSPTGTLKSLHSLWFHYYTTGKRGSYLKRSWICL